MFPLPPLKPLLISFRYCETATTISQFGRTNVTMTALRSLPGDWQAWIAENLARACDPRDMADIMVRENHFSPALVHAAIAEASNGVAKLPTARLMPDVDTRSNSIVTSDRTVEVLVTLIAPR